MTPPTIPTHVWTLSKEASNSRINMPFPRVCLSFCVVGEAESPEWKWLEFGIFIVNNQTNILKPHAVRSRSTFSASSNHVAFPMDVTHSILSPITASAGLHNPYHCLSQHEDSEMEPQRSRRRRLMSAPQLVISRGDASPPDRSQTSRGERG